MCRRYFRSVWGSEEKLSCCVSAGLRACRSATDTIETCRRQLSSKQYHKAVLCREGSNKAKHTTYHELFTANSEAVPPVQKIQSTETSNLQGFCMLKCMRATAKHSCPPKCLVGRKQPSGSRLRQVTAECHSRTKREKSLRLDAPVLGSIVSWCVGHTVQSPRPSMPTKPHLTPTLAGR